ncbi:hypothetical protein B0H14DRAFT_3865231 [Mycena olivaceomarginata]|nr:hypothetical protein B0H14DRAFT_3865231 [Mycena olivaceomarginata]
MRTRFLPHNRPVLAGSWHRIRPPQPPQSDLRFHLSCFRIHRWGHFLLALFPPLIRETTVSTGGRRGRDPFAKRRGEMTRVNVDFSSHNTQISTISS